MKKKTLLSYLGQLRIYSLLDLIIILIAVKATIAEFIGVMLLHIGFLAYLESRHNHQYRQKIPEYLWVICAILGMGFYHHTLFAILFMACSFIYTLKNRSYWGIFSPIMRGMQYLFVIGGVAGFNSRFIWIILLLIFLRNLIGDMRDIKKDREENMKTLPIIIGLKKNIKYVYPIAVLSTTTIWWSYTSLPIYYLPLVFMVQMLGYSLTPR